MRERLGGVELSQGLTAVGFQAPLHDAVARVHVSYPCADLLEHRSHEELHVAPLRVCTQAV